MRKITYIIDYIRIVDIYTYKFIKKIKKKKLDPFFKVITHAGSPYGVFIILILSYLINKYLFFEIFIVGMIDFLFIKVLKTIVKRARPEEKKSKKFNDFLDRYSFPSGHTSVVFAIFTVFTLYFPYFVIPFSFLVILVGISRLYLTAHYFTDVLVGAIIGTGIGIFVHLIFFRVLYHLYLNLN